MTAQGHPRAIFKRAIEHGNVSRLLAAAAVLWTAEAELRDDSGVRVIAIL